MRLQTCDYLTRCIPDTGHCIFVMLRAFSRVVAYNIANVQIIRCAVSSLKDIRYRSLECNMDQNIIMERKIFSMEWKWNGGKLPVWNMDKSSSISFHTMPGL